MKFIILPILFFAVITSFAKVGQALTPQECSQTGQQCLCTAFPGAGGPICTPLKNIAYKESYGLKN
ncbi:MAG: hypothetical protein K2Y08_07545 [Alphaproteobacteria bacterium]|nr:hypothetical protein [Alphaproteobacteria bacterium]